jgi:outer membrane protein
MKQTAIFAVLLTGILASGTAVTAQSKMGCISLNELLSAMPEVKKADTTLAEYRVALQQQFDAYKTDYTTEFALLSSRDTAKFTRPQLDLKRRSLAELLAKLQGYDQEAGQLLEQKRSDLFLPIQKKAEDAIRQVSKDNGYAFVFEKDNLHVYPPSDDILPLVKKSLGLR